MTDGMEISGLQEKPQKVREVSEVKEQLDRAAYKPEEAKEEGDYKQAEALEKEFVAAVPPIEPSIIEIPEGTDPGRQGADGDQTYALKSDAATSLREFAETIDEKENQVGDTAGTSTVPGGSVIADAAEGMVALQSSTGNGGSAIDATNDAEPGDETSDDGTTSSADSSPEPPAVKGDLSSLGGPDSPGDFEDSSADRSAESSAIRVEPIEVVQEASNAAIDFSAVAEAAIINGTNLRATADGVATGHSYTVVETFVDPETGQEHVVLHNEWGEGSNEGSNTISFTELVDHWNTSDVDMQDTLEVTEIHSETLTDSEANLQYLMLQHDLQAQSRQFTMVSNILKVHRDTETSSIDNIRGDEDENETGDSADSPALTQEQISELESIQELINEGGGEADIDTLIQLVMFEVYESEEDQLNDILEDIKTSNEAKQKMREMITELNKQKNKMKESMREEYAGEIKGDAQLAAEMTESPGILEEAVVEGSDLRSTEDVTKELEEKLNEVGDDAQLANIDLQNALQKQQQAIQMMSQLSKILNDTAMAVVRKMSNGGSGSTDSSESSIDEPGETEDSQYEAEAAALVDAILAGEVPVDVKAVIQEVLRESYQDNYEDLEYFADKVKSYNEMKASIREEANILEDELSDWPDGESREITVTTWEEGEDSTYVKVEKTVTLTKEEAKNLLNSMEDMLEAGSDQDASEANSEVTESEYSYHLVEGRILVGEAALAESAVEELGGMVELGNIELLQLEMRLNEYKSFLEIMNEYYPKLLDLSDRFNRGEVPGDFTITIMQIGSGDDGGYAMFEMPIRADVATIASFFYAKDGRRLSEVIKDIEAEIAALT